MFIVSFVTTVPNCKENWKLGCVESSLDKAFPNFRQLNRVPTQLERNIENRSNKYH